MSADQPVPNSAVDDRLVFRPQLGPPGDVLVVIFLRGGMDAVYTIPPLADRAYYDQRKGFGVTEAGQNGLVALDGFFGLHPDFSPLERLYRERQLAIVHAVGLNEPLLSHFDATRAIERGLSDDGGESGWIGRHLAAQQPVRPSPLRAIALGKSMPLVMRGCDARLLDSIAEVRLQVPLEWAPGFSQALARLYARGTDPASVAGRGTLQMLSALDRLKESPYQPANAARYPNSTFGNHFQQVAQLIKAEVGLEAAILSINGWDSHLSQVNTLVRPMRSLAGGLRGFWQDLGDLMQRVVVVVISEFGRRITPNSSGGTDHGRATAMLVVGGGVRGGRVYGRWPGIAADELDEQGNLRVTTDYRNVLAEIVDRRLKNAAIDRVFPRLEPHYLHFTI